MSEEAQDPEPEEPDWLPEETKRRVAARPDYQTKQLPCEACQ
jgi:hypothetical protein